MAIASSNELVNELNNLIALDYDAIAAYDSALDRLVDPNFKNNLRSFRDDHERHVRDLSQLVRTHGGQPRQKGDMKQLMTQGMVLIRGITGDDGILKAMKTNEDQTNAGYERALKTPNLPPDVRTVLERNLSDERRHRAWIVDQLSALNP